MNKNILMFSGQGSQSVGMGQELYNEFTASMQVFDTASEILGYDLAKITFEGPAEELGRTVNSQPAIMACSLAVWAASQELGLEFDGVMGHSLGEYAAMVASGVVTMEDGFRLIKARAEAMQRAADSCSGAMYAIIGLDAAEVEKVCEETEGYVVPVNYNSKVQTVIAGDTDACERAAQRFAEMKKRAIKLGVSSAFHSKMMEPAAKEFLETAKTVTFSKPSVAYFSNVLGARLTDFSGMPELLAKHIVSPVRFTDELAAAQAEGFNNYIEMGPGKVLTGLVKKTLTDVNAMNAEDCTTLSKVLSAVQD